jgi:hypothetical protein
VLECTGHKKAGLFSVSIVDAHTSPSTRNDGFLDLWSSVIVSKKTKQWPEGLPPGHLNYSLRYGEPTYNFPQGGFHLGSAEPVAGHVLNHLTEAPRGCRGTNA